MNKKELATNSLESAVIISLVMYLTRGHRLPVRILTALAANDLAAFVISPTKYMAKVNEVIALTKLEYEKNKLRRETTAIKEEMFDPANWDGDLTKIPGWSQL